MSGSVESSYTLHRAELERHAADEEESDVRERWFRTETADYWRHIRMFEGAKAFLHRPQTRILTVGDGRYGLDSIRLRTLGFTNVLPSDIGDVLLRKSKALGLIDDYAVENAESLSFENESFDIVFCKESFHHFPRPMVALYEMLRVAAEAVILVEPRDFVIDHGPTRATGPSAFVKGLMTWIRDRRGVPHPPLETRQLYLIADEAHYEETGNYGYFISSRELEKVSLGMNLPAMALKGFNDVYLPGAGSKTADQSSKLFRSMKEAVALADRHTRGGRGATNMLMAILFKRQPDQEERDFFKANDWLYRDLPRNPHL